MSPIRRDPVSLIRQSLNRRRGDEADIKYRRYVRPFGTRNLHVVQPRIGGPDYIVSGPRRTYPPGAIVPTGSNTGHPGEFILQESPPGKRGPFSAPPLTKPLVQPGGPLEIVSFTGFLFGETGALNQPFQVVGRNFLADDVISFDFSDLGPIPGACNSADLLMHDMVFLGCEVFSDIPAPGEDPAIDRLCTFDGLADVIEFSGECEYRVRITRLTGEFLISDGSGGVGDI